MRPDQRPHRLDVRLGGQPPNGRRVGLVKQRRGRGQVVPVNSQLRGGEGNQARGVRIGRGALFLVDDLGGRSEVAVERLGERLPAARPGQQPGQPGRLQLPDRVPQLTARVRYLPATQSGRAQREPERSERPVRGQGSRDRLRSFGQHPASGERWLVGRVHHPQRRQPQLEHRLGGRRAVPERLLRPVQIGDGALRAAPAQPGGPQRGRDGRVIRAALGREPADYLLEFGRPPAERGRYSDFRQRARCEVPVTRLGRAPHRLHRLDRARRASALPGLRAAAPRPAAGGAAPRSADPAGSG